MKKLLALAALLVAALTFSGPGLAQTGDAQIDGNSHPNVGALLRQRADGSLTIVCSGTLVSSRVFLTAGHCSDYLLSHDQPAAYVTFDPNFGRDAAHDVFATPYHGQVIENPDWHKPYQNDTAIILLDPASAAAAAAAGITPAKIAPLHFLDGLKADHALNDLAYTNVGYGTSEQVVVPGSGPTFPFDGIRKWTISGFHALDSEYIHLDQNIHRDLSGTGYGDSGGPTFVDTANGPVVVSVVSTGDVPCVSTSVNERVDTDNAQTFLAPYLALK
jgi:secreted trypsin-like serine protease